MTDAADKVVVRVCARACVCVRERERERERDRERQRERETDPAERKLYVRLNQTAKICIVLVTDPGNVVILCV